MKNKKFKVGDKVRIKKLSPYGSIDEHKILSDTHIISRIDSWNAVEINLGRYYGFDNRGYFFFNNEIELIEKHLNENK